MILGFSRPGPSPTGLLVWRTLIWLQNGCEVLSDRRADSLSRLIRPPSLLIPGIKATFFFFRSVALVKAISLRHSFLCVYPIPSSFLEVSDVSTNDIRMIITTIMYWFSGSIVALWVSALPCIIVRTSDGLIAANETSWAIIHHPPHFFSLPGWWTMLVTFVGIIRLVDEEKRKHKINVLLIAVVLGKHPQNEHISLLVRD